MILEANYAQFCLAVGLVCGIFIGIGSNELYRITRGRS